MAISVVRTTTYTETTSGSNAHSFSTLPAAANMIVEACAGRDAYAGRQTSDNQGGTTADYVELVSTVTASGLTVWPMIRSRKSISAPSGTFTVTTAASGNALLACIALEVAGYDTTTPSDQSGSVQNAASSSGWGIGAQTVTCGGAMALADELVVAVGIGRNNGDNITNSFPDPSSDAAYTSLGKNLNNAAACYGHFYRINTVGTTAPSCTMNPSLSGQNNATNVSALAIGTFRGIAVTGIAFDAAANSGDIAAANTFSGNASWAGTNRFLAVDVSLLGPGVNVTSMTYGGAACTFIGSRSTVTSLGAVECWGIKSSAPGAPGTGANTLVVNLSGSIEFSVEWVSYTTVDQTQPTEAFNSNQATNVGAADATVDITTITNNCWVHGAVVASDTSITANQTSRNNIPGTLGSGGNEDNNAAKTPAGTVTMSYTNVAALATWAIAGYAIRPLGSIDVTAWYAHRAARMLGTGMLAS